MENQIENNPLAAGQGPKRACPFSNHFCVQFFVLIWFFIFSPFPPFGRFSTPYRPGVMPTYEIVASVNLREVHS